MSRILPDRFAVFAIDPGGTTGVARGLFEPGEDVADTIGRGEWESWECEGKSTDQAEEIADELIDWHYHLHVERMMPVYDIHIVIEDFVLRVKQATSDRKQLDPVRIISSLEAFLPEDMAGRLEKQQPSHAKSYATSKRLKKWGMWVVGSEHRRDAVRHMALKVSKVLG